MWRIFHLFLNAGSYRYPTMTRLNEALGMIFSLTCCDLSILTCKRNYYYSEQVFLQKEPAAMFCVFVKGLQHKCAVNNVELTLMRSVRDET